jgi:hypothetical protein
MLRGSRNRRREREKGKKALQKPRLSTHSPGMLIMENCNVCKKARQLGYGNPPGVGNIAEKIWWVKIVVAPFLVVL